MSAFDAHDLPEGFPLDLVRAETNKPAPAAVRALAKAAPVQMGLKAEPLAVLYYGSCLRDGVVEGRLVDLYVLVDSYRGALGSGVRAALVRAVPPNVYYVETTHDGTAVRGKAALLSLKQLEQRARPGWRNPYFWARFAQPTGIVSVRDEATRARVEAVLARSVAAVFDAVLPLFGEDSPAHAADFWTRAFAETYRTELRPEKPDRVRQIFEAERERFERSWAWGQHLPHGLDRHVAERAWASRRRHGKALSVLRLVKAAFTFTGGPDYLAWKIERHAGAKVELTPWQRRHPLLAAWPLLFKLMREKAVR